MCWSKKKTKTNQQNRNQCFLDIVFFSRVGVVVDYYVIIHGEFHEKELTFSISVHSARVTRTSSGLSSPWSNAFRDLLPIFGSTHLLPKLINSKDLGSPRMAYCATASFFKFGVPTQCLRVYCFPLVDLIEIGLGFSAMLVGPAPSMVDTYCYSIESFARWPLRCWCVMPSRRIVS